MCLWHNERSVGYYEKYYLLLFLVFIFVLIGFTGCKKENEAETPNIYVSLRNTTTDDVPVLKWIVENRSKTSSVNFKEGDILNYEIRHTRSGKAYTSDEKETDDILLEPEESYETSIKFQDMPNGHYVAKFWAYWNDDKESIMTIQFDVDN